MSPSFVPQDRIPDMSTSSTQVQLADGRPPKPVGTYEELVARAESLIPILRERAEETEELRQLPLATKKDLETTGVARIFQPTRYGGCEGHFFGMVEILTRVGRGCGSTGCPS